MPRRVPVPQQKYLVAGSQLKKGGLVLAYFDLPIQFWTSTTAPPPPNLSTKRVNQGSF